MWVPFFDRFGTLLRGQTSLVGLAASAVLAALACYFLLYYIPALWGQKAHIGLSLAGASTFGTLGSEWITGVGTALAAIVFYAIALATAIRLTLLGLICCGLMSPSALRTMSAGPFHIQSPVFLTTLLFWIFIIGMANLLRLPRVIVALMQVYTPVAILLLGVTAMLTSPGLSSFPAVRSFLSSLDARAPSSVATGGPHLFELIFGYFAVSGLMAIEWGQAVRDRRDIRIGGWLAVILAGSWCAVMALLTVAGALGTPGTGILAGEGFAEAAPLSFHWALYRGVGGWTGGAILLLFGLATLAPACYSAWIFSTRLSQHWPRIRRFYWTWIGGAAAFVLVAFSWADRLELIFAVMGAIFAPAVGSIVADALRQRLQWHGIREGLNPPGLIAWSVGLVIGLIPVIGARMGVAVSERFQPAALFSFLSAAIVYTLLAASGWERPWVRLPERESMDSHTTLNGSKTGEIAARMSS
jgi:cytosine permease